MRIVLQTFMSNEFQISITKIKNQSKNIYYIEFYTSIKYLENTF